MQQQSADYDLLAVFNDEPSAEAAATKLKKEGFGEEEVFQVSPNAAGQFREHGPSRNRSDVFLRTTRSGPNPLLIVLLAIAFAIVFGGVGFIVLLVLLAIHILLLTTAIVEPTVLIVGAVGLIVGAITGFTRRGRVRGNIGQDMSRVNATRIDRTGSTGVTGSTAIKGARNAIALRFPDAENISRRSRARAILIQNGGKIDRSIGRTE